MGKDRAYNININDMKDFNYYAPTEVVFGKQSEEQVAALGNLHNSMD